MNRLASIADKIARNITAGVSIGVKGYVPKDIFWVENQLREALREFGNDQVLIDIDGSTRPLNYTGTINLYIKDLPVLEKITAKAWDVITHLKMVGINGKVRTDTSKMYNLPTVRVDIDSNQDEQFASLESTHITYSNWKRILTFLGFEKLNEMGGEMPIHHYLYAIFDKVYDWQDERLKRYANQIAEMCREAMKHGYKDIRWN